MIWLKKRHGLLPRPNRWLWAMPNLALICFLAAGVALLLFFRSNEHRRQHDELVQHLLWQEQTLRDTLSARQGTLEAMAHDFVRGDLSEGAFYDRSQMLMAKSPEVLAIAYANEFGEAIWSYPAQAMSPLQMVPAVIEPLQRSARIGVAASTPAFDYPGSGAAVALSFPAVQGNHTLGSFVAVISLKGLLRGYVPWWIAKRYQLGFIDIEGRTVASRPEQAVLDSAKLSYDVAFDPTGYGLRLRASAFQTSWPIWQHALYWLLGVLSALMLWSLWVLKRHMHERLIAERAMLREMNMRRALEDSLVSGVFAADLEGRTLHVNRSFCRMVGYEAAELIGGMTPYPYWAPEGIARCEQVFSSILRGECPINGFSLRYQKKNGDRFDIRLYSSPLIDGEGKQTGWVASVTDVTELKREREALKASHERFVAVLNGLDAAVAVTDQRNGELLLTNRAFREAFRLVAPDGAICALPLRQADAGGEWFDAVLGRWYQHHRRETLWVDQSRVWLDIATDVTERKQATERDRQHAEKLQQTARLIAMGEMASSLAHELNQPLAAISSYSTACRNLVANQQISPSELDDALGKIAEQSRRAGAIIRGIREFVQKREPQRSHCQFGELLDTVLSLLAAPIKQHKVRLVADRTLDATPLYADRVMLEQVLFNLGKNAIEAMEDIPPAGRELTLLATLRGDWLDIVVADRGHGIAPDQLDKLFRPFYTTKAEGMGMGLNICRTIVEHHQGRLVVETREGGGSRFVVSLPLTTKTLLIKDIEHHAH